VAFGGMEEISRVANGGANVEFVGRGAGKGDTKTGDAIESEFVVGGGADVREEGSRCGGSWGWARGIGK
jgi:hypothetical protein